MAESTWDRNSYYEDGAIRYEYVGRTRPRNPDGTPEHSAELFGSPGHYYRRNLAEERRRRAAESDAVPGTGAFYPAPPPVIALRRSPAAVGINIDGAARDLTPLQARAIAKVLESKADMALGGFCDQDETQAEVPGNRRRCLVPACTAYATVHAGHPHESDRFEHPKWRIAVQKHDTELRWTVQASLTNTNVLSAAEAISFANDMRYAAADAARLNKAIPEDQ